MQISVLTLDAVGKSRFIDRMVELLINAQSVTPTIDRKLLSTKVAEVLDEAEENGIKTERLMGMIVLLKLSDDVNPFAIPAYQRVLTDQNLEEDDKAHILQMMRLGEL